MRVNLTLHLNVNVLNSLNAFHCGHYLYQVGSRHPPLLKMLLPVLLLNLQSKARAQNSLRVRGQIKVRSATNSGREDPLNLVSAHKFKNRHWVYYV